MPRWPAPGVLPSSSRGTCSERAVVNQVELFEQHRSLLFSIAYRMLGSVADAEDMVQDAFLRWQKVSETEVQSPRAYLVAVVTRLSIDHLRSARVQREEYLGEWLPEPLLTDLNQEAEKSPVLAESLTMAFLVLLESLTPLERAAFLLREVFEYDYPEVAAIVERGEVHCRQMVRRARQRIAERRPRFKVSLEQRERLTERFFLACRKGDMDGLVALLAEDVTLWSDGGEKVRAALRPIYGAVKVARFLLGVQSKLPPGVACQPAEVNGQPGLISYLKDQPIGTLALDIQEGRIKRIYLVVNPEKLRSLPPLA